MYKYFKDLEIRQKHFLSNNGETINATEYLKRHYAETKRRIEENIVPREYDNPLGVQFELTSKCNQKCIHCYNQSNDFKHNDIQSELSTKEWKAIAREAVSMGIFQCVISGGEPTTLGNELFEIMDILHKGGVEFVVISNGMLINEQMITKFKKYKFSWFQVSIDGSRDYIHDYIRGAKSFEKALNAANLVKEAGLPLVIAHAVMKKNFNYFEEMIDLAFLLGAKRLVTGPYTYMGRAVKNNDQINLTDKECDKVYEICERKAKEYSGKMIIAISTEEPISLRKKLASPNDVMLIRPNGDVKFDCVSPFKIGNVKEQSLKEIWDSKGKSVNSSQCLLDYIKQIKAAKDLLRVKPRVNVDPDILL